MLLELVYNEEVNANFLQEEMWLCRAIGQLMQLTLENTTVLVQTCHHDLLSQLEADLSALHEWRIL